MQYWTPNKFIYEFSYANEVALEECAKRNIDVMFGWEMTEVRRTETGEKIAIFRNVDTNEVIEKSFFTAMIATYAVAEQVINPGIEAGDKGEFLVNIMNNLSGNVNANSFGPEKDARANEAAAAAMQWMNANQNVMPRVCTKGQECRDAIQDATEKEIQEQWSGLLDRIGQKFENALVRNLQTLEDAWTKADACPHGCFCPTAWIRYTELIEKQNAIHKDVDKLIDDLRELYD
jgi:hypothetical protein